MHRPRAALLRFVLQARVRPTHRQGQADAPDARRALDAESRAAHARGLRRRCRDRPLPRDGGFGQPRLPPAAARAAPTRRFGGDLRLPPRGRHGDRLPLPGRRPPHARHVERRHRRAARRYLPVLPDATQRQPLPPAGLPPPLRARRRVALRRGARRRHGRGHPRAAHRHPQGRRRHHPAGDAVPAAAAPLHRGDPHRVAALLGARASRRVERRAPADAQAARALGPAQGGPPRLHCRPAGSLLHLPPPLWRRPAGGPRVGRRRRARLLPRADVTRLLAPPLRRSARFLVRRRRRGARRRRGHDHCHAADGARRRGRGPHGLLLRGGAVRVPRAGEGRGHPRLPAALPPRAPLPRHALRAAAPLAPAALVLLRLAAPPRDAPRPHRRLGRASAAAGFRRVALLAD
mmetsp:Transcript_67590/g.185299  ORF Transcript_67590/g.185299 Transcript_67590/m.185299 type:complete len:405 (-) Transcript_67590:28-1242(-)